jgi:hypothetical protein
LKTLGKILLSLLGILLILWLCIELFAARFVRDGISSQLKYYSSDTLYIEQVNITYFPLGLELINMRFDLHIPLDSSLVSYTGTLEEARVKGVNVLDILRGKAWEIGLVEAEEANMNWVVSKSTKPLRSMGEKGGSGFRDILIEKVNFEDLNLSVKRDSLHLVFNSSLRLDSLDILRADSLQWRVGGIALNSNQGYFKELLENYEIGYKNFSYQSTSTDLRLEGFYLKPTRSREAFIKETKYLSIHSRIELPLLVLSGIDHNRLNRGLFAHKLTLDSLSAELFEDSRKPRAPGRLPLPSESLLKLPFELSIDTLEITHALVEYYEKAKTENGLGYLKIDRLHATAYPINNIGFEYATELWLNASGRLMEGAVLQLNAHFEPESKTHAFQLTADLGAMDVTRFNPTLKPLINLGLKSGETQRIYASLSGDDYYARGWVKMAYTNLKVELPPKDGEKKSFFGRVTQSLGNFAVVNNNHDFDDKRGEIDYKRDVRRPFINYWWIALREGIKEVVTVF